MPRNISFALTTQAFIERRKSVTRRFAWWDLEAGAELMVCKKVMGLKKGEKIERLGRIRVISVRTEPLCEITKSDCIKEGFPDLTPAQFIDMICKHNHGRVQPHTLCNRIEFEYLCRGTDDNIN